jgi:hypothetical protein
MFIYRVIRGINRLDNHHYNHMLSSKREDAAESDRKVDYAAMGRAETILDLNGLKYRIPQKLSSAVSRSYKKEFSIKGNHGAGDVITFDLNTGSNYVDPESAMLSFKVDITTTAPGEGDPHYYTWAGNMGGAAIIDEIRIISKNGVELDRVQDAALLATVWSNYNLSPESKAMVGMANGYDDTVAIATRGETVTNTATSFDTPLDVSIPLKYICGFFRPVVQGMLMPAGLASGLRIEISLTNKLNQPFVSAAGAKPTAFNVYDAELLLQTTMLNDSTASALMSESSSNGLEYTFPSYYSTKLNIAANATFSTQINKAVSQGVRAFLALQNPYVDDITSDKLISQDISNIETYQWRVGQQYFPNQVVSRKQQAYVYAQDGMLGLRNVELRPNQVRYKDYFSGKGVVATSLETSARLNLSGLMLNNSSVLAIEGTLGAAAGGARGSLFLEFVAVARTALNRTQLKI